MSRPRPNSNYGGRGGTGFQGPVRQNTPGIPARGGVSKGGQQAKRQKQNFEPYWPEGRVREGIRQGELIEGPLRISEKNSYEAYVPLPDGSLSILVGGFLARNRALPFDVVVVKPLPFDQWMVSKHKFDLFEKEQSSRKAKRENREDRSKRDSDEEEEDSHDSDISSESGSDDEYESSIQGAVGGSRGEVPRSWHTVESGLEKLSVSKDSSLENPRGASKPEKKKGAKHENRLVSVSEMIKSGSSFARALFERGPESVEEEDFVWQTGKVVFISEKRHSGVACGKLSLMPNKSEKLASFTPLDRRLPRMVIPMKECPRDFMKRADEYSDKLYLAEIVDWKEKFRSPEGTLVSYLGEAGEIEAETTAMLTSLDLDDTDFSEEVTACLPTERVPWKIPNDEIQARVDFRETCVFTIDAPKTKDLDDALSITMDSAGNYEVAVHVADVSYFVTEGTPLDDEAAARAISVYLVKKNIPMLPTRLCEDLCSLKKDEDRLAFSVVWKMTKTGQILDCWIRRSVIRSCARLTFDQAQDFIEDTRDWKTSELLSISKPYTVQDVMEKVQTLSQIAEHLHRQRIKNGALQLQRVDFEYTCDDETRLPNGYALIESKDSIRLVEEFMILANETVACEIKERFPDMAVLFHQPPPKSKALTSLEEWGDSLGFQINTSSSGELQESLSRCGAGEDEFSHARKMVLSGMVIQRMQSSSYFCAATIPDESQHHHYTLNVPVYTTFTSPIRKYSDIMVHRLLAASLGYCDLPEKSEDDLQRQAEHCNDRKRLANRASIQHRDLYFSVLVKERGPLKLKGVVTAVSGKSFEVLFLELEIKKRVYLKNLPVENVEFRTNGKLKELELEWTNHGRTTSHVITVFTLVDCILEAEEQPLAWKCVIRRPRQRAQPRSGRK